MSAECGACWQSSWDGSIKSTRRVQWRLPGCSASCPATMTPWTTTERSYDAIVCDGTAGCHRPFVGRFCAATKNRGVVRGGVDVAIVSGTHIGNVDGQLNARPAWAGTALAVPNGSEVFQVGPHGPVLSWRRQASRAENRALDEAARQTVDELGERGLQAAVVSSRLNRRKIDLIPLPSGLVLHRSISRAAGRRRRAAQGLWPLLARRSRQPGS